MIGMNRRTFLKSVAASSVVGLFGRAKAGRLLNTGFFGVHPFVEQHPDAVFIMRTFVDQKYNKTAKKNTGDIFAKSVFVSKGANENNAFPTSRIIAMKPNLTGYKQSEPTEYKMGIVTDPYFMEGMIDGMKTLGISGNQFHLHRIE